MTSTKQGEGELEGLIRNRFQAFGALEAVGRSPLYQRLAMAIAGEPQYIAKSVRGIVEHEKNVPLPNIVFAAVHYMLLNGTDHPLARYYPSVTHASPPEDDPYPAFRDFWLKYSDALEECMRTRRVQTNEVRRAACLVPGLLHIAEHTGPTELTLVEIGTSAGLLLNFDRYAYHYEPGATLGDISSPVHLPCEWRGEHPPPQSLPFPKIKQRLGVDLRPLDLSNPEDVLWVRAMAWPDQKERMELLDAAISLQREYTPTLIKADARKWVADGSLDAITTKHIALFHFFTTIQFSTEDRDAFDDALAHASEDRLIYRLSCESLTGKTPELTLTIYQNGEKESLKLAECDPHGNWIKWL